MTQSNNKEADLLSFQDHKVIRHQLREAQTPEQLK
jgi:hypothetical protein